jgi:hypothetical protein
MCEEVLRHPTPHSGVALLKKFSKALTFGRVRDFIENRRQLAALERRTELISRFVFLDVEGRALRRTGCER